MRDRGIIAGITFLFAAVLGAYSNHFHNGFHFDDFHTITENPYVHDLHNLPRFFTDARTFSILPDHDAYRPLVSASIALDYWLGKGANPFWFHVSTFAWYLLQLVLMYLLYAAVMDGAEPHPSNRWFALFAAALYGLHPASAETVNYIIQRGDIYSTLGAVAGLVLYIRFPQKRSTGLYLGSVVLAILSKPTAVAFVSLLFTYILLFEENGRWGKSAKRSIPALAVCAATGLFATFMNAGTFAGGGANPSLYWLTECYVTWHYFRLFFWPSGLTADSDLTLARGVTDAHVLFGIAFVAALCVLARVAARRRQMYPVAFGLAWFLIALLPVGLTPLAEVENDHRMFFPFIGLALAAAWALRLITRGEPRSAAIPALIALAACFYATRQRNEVWRTEETLWRDVTQKSPRNGRGHMNYGLTQMAKGDFKTALASFQTALPLTPNYSLLHINIAIAEGALGNDADAARHFAEALMLAPDDSNSYFYFARWLAGRHRNAQAIALLETGIHKTPSDMQCRVFLLNLYADEQAFDKFRPLLADSLRMAPNDPALIGLRDRQPAAPKPGEQTRQTPEEFLRLSLTYYQAGRYEDCIQAAKQALVLNPDYAEAYNNIAAGSNALGRYEEGIRAASAALRLKPDFPLARNNLAWAQRELARGRQQK